MSQIEAAAAEQIHVDTFTHHHQPFGTLVLKDCIWTPIVAIAGSPDYVRHCAAEGLGELVGTCIEGGVTDRLFHATAFTSHVGKRETVWAVSKADLARGHKTTVAM